jgi:hypothetical protein
MTMTDFTDCCEHMNTRVTETGGRLLQQFVRSSTLSESLTPNICPPELF